jgi:tRNA threonylcarbamoyladenosine biosynthesis protein TsaB
LNLLGFDTSTAASSACVLRGDGASFEIVPDASALLEAPRHAAELLPAAVSVMDRSGLDWRELDAIAVGVGPGGFTGLRIGIATARALAGANATELRPVSSLATLAAGIDAPLKLPLIDARRGELFAALYEGATERWPPFVAAPEAVIGRLRDEGCTPVAAGDGSIRFSELLQAGGVEVAPAESLLHVVRGLHLCRLAARAPARPPATVVPTYLRLPDAKPAR